MSKLVLRGGLLSCIMFPSGQVLNELIFPRIVPASLDLSVRFCVFCNPPMVSIFTVIVPSHEPLIHSLLSPSCQLTFILVRGFVFSLMHYV